MSIYSMLLRQRPLKPSAGATEVHKYDVVVIVSSIFLHPTIHTISVYHT